MVTITDKKYSEKDSELRANAMENIKCREGVCLSTDTKLWIGKTVRFFWRWILATSLFSIRTT